MAGLRLPHPAVRGVAAAAIPLLPRLQRELELSGLQTALLLSTTTVAMLLAPLPCGVIATRYGHRRVLVVGAVIAPLALLLAAALPRSARSSPRAA